MSLRYFQLVQDGALEEDALAVTTTVDCSVEPSRTKQSFAQEADINFLMERYIRTGEFPGVEDLGVRQPLFGDFSDGVTFQDALERVRAAEESFQELPARVRDRFRNDPGEFLDFIGDDRNREEALKLGLVAERRAQEARSDRSRAEDAKAREIEAAERRGREAAGGTIRT